MSRSYCSYDEEWQRRKSVLIRSLFHDIPILSPVEEESTDSSQDYYAPKQEVFPSPPRPYSPLPPLIIERVPVINKHDEPEEYYRKLHKKIKRIYLKLFVEKRNESSVDYGSNYSVSSVNDDNLMNTDDSESVENLDFRFLERISPNNGNFDSIIEDREARLSSASTKSNGYGADFESMDTAIVDVTKYTTSNEEVVMISEEEESDSECFDNDGFQFTKSIECRTSSRERADVGSLSDEQNVRHSTIVDQESGESDEDEQSYEEEESANDLNQTGELDKIRINYAEISGSEESHHSRINEQVRANSQVESRKQSINVTNTYSETIPKGGENTATEESNIETMEGDVGTSSSSEGPDYRQITIEALVHYDGTQDTEDRESRVYEDSMKSVILPTRFRRVISHNVDERIEVLAALEEKDDPKTTPIFTTDDDQTTDLEEVTTPQPEATETGDEKTKTPQDAIDEDTGAMRSSTSETTDQDAPEEDIEESRSHQLDLAEKNLQESGTYRQKDPTTYAEKITHQKDVFEKKIEAMRTLQQTFTEKYIEEIKTHKSVVAEKEIESMTTPPLTTIEKDFRSAIITTPETINEMRTAHLISADAEMRSRQSEFDMEEDDEESNEEIKSPHPIEIMRTPRAAFSHGTIPETHESNSGSSFEHAALPQEAAEMTSSFQDGVDNNVSEIQTSNDMNEVLTSIFNESRSKGEASISGNKRKLVDKSVQAVQTRRVTWDEMRSNFFVATPKIFRLCACTDHVCY